MRKPPSHRPIGDPRVGAVLRVWQGNGLCKGTIATYLRFVRIFLEGSPGSTDADLTRESVDRFSARYIRKYKVDARVTNALARSALRAWAWGLMSCGASTPPWLPNRLEKPLPPLLRIYADHRRNVRGVTPSGIAREVTELRAFFGFLKARRRTSGQANLGDVDAYIFKLRLRLARRTVARVCCSIRAYFRFLRAEGRLAHDLASSVIGPRCRQSEVPPRAMPWKDVLAILKAVDRRIPSGRRDYALLLLMASYGLGSGEVRGLRLEDINWLRGEFRIRRPKTGHEITLPLLPAVSRALIAYIRRGRPLHTTSPAVFVKMKAPHDSMQASSAIRHVLVKHAHAAGVTGRFLGSHALRHSHATRQIDLGARQEVVGDILGHKSPHSTSVYVRVALRRLRALALPVPK